MARSSWSPPPTPRPTPAETDQRDAVIGIHGPLGANTIIGITGAYISPSCIRLRIPDLNLLRNVPAGSPIAITQT